MSSIDFHEKLHDRVGVEEQHGDGKSENAMSVKTVLMFASIILHKDIELAFQLRKLLSMMIHL